MSLKQRRTLAAPSCRQPPKPLRLFLASLTRLGALSTLAASAQALTPSVRAALAGLAGNVFNAGALMGTAVSMVVNDSPQAGDSFTWHQPAPAAGQPAGQLQPRPARA